MTEFDKILEEKYQEYLTLNLDLLLLGGKDEKTLSLKPENIINTKNMYRLCNLEFNEKDILRIDNSSFNEKIFNTETNELIFDEKDSGHIFLGCVDNLILICSRTNGEYKVVNLDKKIISCGNVTIDDLPIIYSGLIMVRINNKINFKDKNGNLLFKEGFDKLRKNFKDGFAEVIKNNKLYYILPNGKMFSNSDLLILNYVNMKDSKIKKTMLGYKISEPNTKDYVIKYMPILDMGCYILCYDNNNIYLYNKYNKKDKYINLGPMGFDFKYNDNLLLINEKVYLIYKNNLLDITDYYNSKLKGKDSITIGNIDILSKDDFTNENYMKFLNEYEETKKLILEEHKKELIRQKELLEKQKLKLEIEEKRKKEKELEEKVIKEHDEAVEALINYGSVKVTNNRLNYDLELLIKKVNDHFEFNKEIIPYLRYINLVGFDYTNFKLNNLDLSNTNIIFDPQLVYNKDLSNGNYTNINFFGKSFKDVNICGTKLGGDIIKGSGIFPYQFEGCIYDENTTYNNIPLKEYLNIKTR